MSSDGSTVALWGIDNDSVLVWEDPRGGGTTSYHHPPKLWAGTVGSIADADGSLLLVDSAGQFWNPRETSQTFRNRLSGIDGKVLLVGGARELPYAVFRDGRVVRAGRSLANAVDLADSASPALITSGSPPVLWSRATGRILVLSSPPSTHQIGHFPFRSQQDPRKVSGPLWRIVGAIAVDDLFLLTVADLRSDTRMLVLLDSVFAVRSCRRMASRMTILAKAYSAPLLLVGSSIGGGSITLMKIIDVTNGTKPAPGLRADCE